MASGCVARLLSMSWRQSIGVEFVVVKFVLVIWEFGSSMVLYILE